MKRLLATILCCAMLVSVTACSFNSGDNTEATIPIATTATEATSGTEAMMSNDEIKAHIDSVLKKMKFDGIVYLTQNGSVAYQSATGKDDKGNDIALESSMYIGSLSKQFCATAIMMLKEQGKLSVDDTLDKYFPEYQYGKDITIKNLLTMRSGIPNCNAYENAIFSEIDEYNTENVLACFFNQPLNFDPDTSYEYSNPNYFILACIVEQVSGKDYHAFIRENIFKPLEMSNTGFANEIKNNPEWVTGLDYNELILPDSDVKMTMDDEIFTAKGAGDIVSNAYDMDKWMTGLVSGKLISRESYEEMSDNYTTEIAIRYGYGLERRYGGVCHSGNFETYVTIDYINENYGYNMFIANNEYYGMLHDLTLNILQPFIN